MTASTVRRRPHRIGDVATAADRIAVTLCLARQQQRLTQRQLALRIGCAQSAIAEWETSVTSPRLANVADWAQALGYDLVLTRRTEEQP